MPATQDLKDRICAAIDSRAEEAVKVAKAVASHAETGFRETKTAALVADWFRRAGVPTRTGIGVTGVISKLDTGRPGPHVAVMGELDSLIVPGHPDAVSETGAAHACGHHAQLGSMIGVAMAMLDNNVLRNLGGSISFMAVPAEEYIELGYRESLREAGKLEFFGGKQEFIRLGELDNVDIAMLTHTGSDEDAAFGVGGSNNGMLGKSVQFIGTAAHAGGSPHLGVNALNAAHIALGGIHANRETFRDADTVRVHPIITAGGDSVNSVPADVHMETYVRGATVKAILDGSKKVDRALRAGALGVGGQVRIVTSPGYMPAKYDENLTDIYRRNAESLVGEDRVMTLGHKTGCTDMGDVSQVVPTIQPTVFAATGRGHGVDYIVSDYELGVVTAAKAMATTIGDLLADDAAAGRRVVEQFKAPMSRSEYVEQLRSMRVDQTYSE